MTTIPPDLTGFTTSVTQLTNNEVDAVIINGVVYHVTWVSHSGTNLDNDTLAKAKTAWQNTLPQLSQIGDFDKITKITTDGIEKQGGLISFLDQEAKDSMLILEEAVHGQEIKELKEMFPSPPCKDTIKEFTDTIFSIFSSDKAKAILHPQSAEDCNKLDFEEKLKLLKTIASDEARKTFIDKLNIELNEKGAVFRWTPKNVEKIQAILTSLDSKILANDLAKNNPIFSENLKTLYESTSLETAIEVLLPYMQEKEEPSSATSAFTLAYSLALFQRDFYKGVSEHPPTLPEKISESFGIELPEEGTINDMVMPKMDERPPLLRSLKHNLKDKLNLKSTNSDFSKTLNDKIEKENLKALTDCLITALDKNPKTIFLSDEEKELKLKAIFSALSESQIEMQKLVLKSATTGEEKAIDALEKLSLDLELFIDENYEILIKATSVLGKPISSEDPKLFPLEVEMIYNFTDNSLNYSFNPISSPAKAYPGLNTYLGAVGITDPFRCVTLP